MTMYYVTLKSTGNPDHHEHYGEGVKSPSQTRPGKTTADCSALVRAYIGK